MPGAIEVTTVTNEHISSRGKFSSSEGIYLLSHSIGKMPISAAEYTNEHFFKVWHEQTTEAWPIWLTSINKFQTALAQLFNSSATAFCPQVNVSSGLTKVLGSLPAHRGKNAIVFTENDFPSAGFVLHQAKKRGFEPRMIAKSENAQDLSVWDQALKDDVHSVFITHVHYNTGELIAVAEICEIARARGITSIVDMAQSTGVVPIDLQRWRADIVLGSCIKWLCGGPGAGFVWIAPEFVGELEPIDVGWFSHKNPFEFDINNFQYASGSAKFWGGTPSVLPYVVATNSIQLINDIGVEVVQAHNKSLTKKIVKQIDPRFVMSPLDFERQGGTTVLKFENQTKIELALTESKVQFDTRESGIRLSPHIYNTQAEIDVVLDCLLGA